MEVVIVSGPDEAGALVGGAIAALIDRRPRAVLGLATGSSPVAVYRDLARRVAHELHVAPGLEQDPSAERGRGFLGLEGAGLRVGRGRGQHEQEGRAQGFHRLSG